MLSGSTGMTGTIGTIPKIGSSSRGGAMNDNDIATMLKANLERLPFNVNDIPSWVIDRACGKKNAGFCIVSMQDGYIGIEHETEKAYLLYVENTFNTPKCAGWEFWVAKSLLK